jgi:hypothetical protein
MMPGTDPALSLDRLACEAVARAYLLRADGPPLSCRSYRDTDGLVVVMKVPPGASWALSERWAERSCVGRGRD